jgi:hypothetical protein
VGGEIQLRVAPARNRTLRRPTPHNPAPLSNEPLEPTGLVVYPSPTLLAIWYRVVPHPVRMNANANAEPSKHRRDSEISVENGNGVFETLGQPDSQVSRSRKRSSDEDEELLNGVVKYEGGENGSSRTKKTRVRTGESGGYPTQELQTADMSRLLAV